MERRSSFFIFCLFATVIACMPFTQSEAQPSLATSCNTSIENRAPETTARKFATAVAQLAETDFLNPRHVASLLCIDLVQSGEAAHIGRAVLNMRTERALVPIAVSVSLIKQLGWGHVTIDIEKPRHQQYDSEAPCLLSTELYSQLTQPWKSTSNVDPLHMIKRQELVWVDAFRRKTMTPDVAVMEVNCLYRIDIDYSEIKK
jgi:hypothetical protein